jgi:L-alanine-DL-glutamate epimerase-like enolase superfamily enzyme
MRIVAIRECAVAINSTQRNSRFDFRSMDTSVVAVVTDVVRDGAPLCGFAFNSFGRYNCGAMIRDRFAPKLLAADPAALLDDAGTNFDPARAVEVMLQRERSGGHAERCIPIGTLELAIWDLVAKVEGRPLYRVLADRFNRGQARDVVPVYVGGGWYAPGQTPADLAREMKGYLAAGYRMVKTKIGGLPLAQDIERIQTLLELVGGGQALAVDANCGFDRERAFAYAEALAPLGLRWLEEPCDPMDYALYRELAEVYPHALGNGENFSGNRELENFLLYSGFRPGLDVIQVDPPLAYGIGEYVACLATAGRHGFGPESMYPHGGNLMSLHVVAGLGLAACEAYTGVFGIFSGFGEEVTVADGHVTLPEAPGIGFERQPALWSVMRDLAGVL